MKQEVIRINETSYLETYILHHSNEYNVKKRKPLVIVLPGGGYAFTSDREAEPIALKFNSIGMHSVVLRYTVNDLVENVPINALIETAKAIKYVREQSDRWLLDSNKIIVCGFSAGGHLALQIATRWHEDWLAKEVESKSSQLKVNLAIPCYPTLLNQAFDDDDYGFAHQLIKNPNTANVRFFGAKNPTEEQISQNSILKYITDKTPPMFIWHTFEDILVDVENSLTLSLALRKQNIPFEMHIFEKGEHGLALCDRTTARKQSHYNAHVRNWFTLCEQWLSSYIDE